MSVARDVRSPVMAAQIYTTCTHNQHPAQMDLPRHSMAAGDFSRERIYFFIFGLLAAVVVGVLFSLGAFGFPVRVGAYQTKPTKNGQTFQICHLSMQTEPNPMPPSSLKTTENDGHQFEVSRHSVISVRSHNHYGCGRRSRRSDDMDKKSHYMRNH